MPRTRPRRRRRPKGQASAAAVTDENSEIRYTMEVEGLTAIGNSEELLKAFRKQSALEADRKDPANAAQIGRRSQRRRGPPRRTPAKPGLL